MQLVTGLVNDARAVLAAVEGLELGGEAVDAVGLLALVAGQDVEPGDETGPGGSPARPPRTGSSPPSTRSPGTSTRPSVPTATATRPTSWSSPGPG